jgi:hypothetical protein
LVVASSLKISQNLSKSLKISQNLSKSLKLQLCPNPNQTEFLKTFMLRALASPPKMNQNAATCDVASTCVPHFVVFRAYCEDGAFT